MLRHSQQLQQAPGRPKPFRSSHNNKKIPHNIRLQVNLCAMQEVEELTAKAQELDRSLRQVQQECTEAVTAALAVVGRPTTPRGSPRSSRDGAATANVTDVVRQLMDKLKVWHASLCTSCCSLSCSSCSATPAH